MPDFSQNVTKFEKHVGLTYTLVTKSVVSEFMKIKLVKLQVSVTMN